MKVKLTKRAAREGQMNLSMKITYQPFTIKLNGQKMYGPQGIWKEESFDLTANLFENITEHCEVLKIGVNFFLEVSPVHITLQHSSKTMCKYSCH